METADRAQGQGEPRERASTGDGLLRALWSSPLPIVVVDRALRVVEVNAAAARAIESAPRALAGERAEVVLPSLGRLPELRAALDAGTGFDEIPIELPVRGAPPSRWRGSVRPIHAPDGAVSGACVVLVEETPASAGEEVPFEARREAELAIQALIRLQAVTAALAAALTPAQVARAVTEQGIGLLDASAGSISWAVGREQLEVLEAFGYPDDALAQGARFAIDVRAPLADAFRTGDAVWLESPADHAARYPHLRGGTHHHHAHDGASVAVPLVAGERVVGVLGMDFDAPRRFDAPDRSVILAIAHQTAEALERARLYEQQHALRAEAERSAALLDTMFSGVPIGLAFVDWDLRLVHVNSAWARLHGRRPGACKGKLVTDALPGEEGASRVGRWRRVLAGGEPVLDVEEHRAAADDPTIVRTWLESCYPVVAGGDTVGLAVVSREITSARRAEEFRRNLLGIVGHDLRNPLSAISGFAHVLRRSGSLDEQQLRTVGRIDECALKAARIAHDLLDLTRIESARGIRIEPRALRVDELCAAVVAEAETGLAGPRVMVTGRGDPAVRWDPERASQALTNLVANALKHGAPDTTITVEWNGTGDPVWIRVHNAGAPIPPAVRAHLFEPFRQGVEAGGRASGVGLGLFITHEIVRAHGGTLDVRSSEREGTSFTLRLPREAAR